MSLAILLLILTASAQLDVEEDAPIEEPTDTVYKTIVENYHTGSVINDTGKNIAEVEMLVPITTPEGEVITLRAVVKFPSERIDDRAYLESLVAEKQEELHAAYEEVYQNKRVEVDSPIANQEYVIVEG